MLIIDVFTLPRKKDVLCVQKLEEKLFVKALFMTE